MGSFLFANQYLNEIVPEGEQPFQRKWFRYYEKLPEIKHTFAFIDPAISQKENADYTALTVIDVDVNQTWYLKCAQRFKINPTQIVQLAFRAHEQFQCNCIGIEDVAYQAALLYMLDEEMKRRKIILPIKGIKPTPDKTKETRIMGLVPRFEWGRILMAQGLADFEIECLQFPRGSHDDLLDSLAYMEQIVFYPQLKKEPERDPSPNDPRYESWYIKKLYERNKKDGDEETESYDVGSG